MSAPVHHIRQNVCLTRPAYREGRQAKAVKVYTVAQESSYIVIQGIPAVGAQQDLVKLCSSFGVVDTFRPLDDYPSEEFTEVYLFKYEKIHSARYAKKKLDDTSFFGGVLHVCYAPEYETVQQTREKLQDRRKQVASKIRQNAQETSGSKKIYNKTKSERTEDKHKADEPIQDILKHVRNLEKNEHFKSSSSTTTTSKSVHHQTSGSQHHAPVSQSHTRVSHHHTPGIHHHMPVNQCQDVNNQITFSIPPPPQYGFHPHYAPHYQTQYDFANVPSAHATLPQNYDGRLFTETSGQSVNNPSLENISERQSNKTNIETNTKLNTTNQDSGSKETTHPHKLVNGLVVKDYKTNHPVPKFIPRQALKKSETLTTSVKVKKDDDSFNREIKKNAFTLGEPQGPELPDNMAATQTVKIPRETILSVNSSVKEIRKQVSKFTSEPPVKKTKIK